MIILSTQQLQIRTMTKTALVSLNQSTGKWEAKFNGEVIAKGATPQYLRKVIENGHNGKALNMGIRRVEMAGESKEEGVHHAAPLIEFSISERFDFLADYVDMVANRDMKSTIIVGSGGLGKTHTVMSRLAKNKLREFSLVNLEEGTTIPLEQQQKQYIVVKGYSTAKGLFRTLYENRNRLVVFDDCDSILSDAVASNLLKAALDSYDRRIVTWNAESFGESDLPRSFEFTGAVIFISNMSMRKIPQAIISRSAPADVSMTKSEVVERMEQIVRSGEFMEEVPMDIKLEAVEFIGQHIHNPQVGDVNMRTLISVVTNRRCKPSTWERLSLSMMVAAGNR